jgi:hypothetical protein
VPSTTTTTTTTNNQQQQQPKELYKLTHRGLQPI